MISTTTVPSATRAETHYLNTTHIDYSSILIDVMLPLLGMVIFACTIWLLFIYFRKKSKIVYNLSCYIVIIQALTNGFFKRSSFHKFHNSIFADSDKSTPNLITSNIYWLISKLEAFYACAACTFQLPSLLKHHLIFIWFY